MTKTIKALLLGAAMTTLPLAASALTTFGTPQGPTTVSTTTTATDEIATVNFTYGAKAKTSGWVDFTASDVFDVLFTNYTPNQSGMRSGFILINLDTTTRLTTGVNCASPSAAIAGTCTLIGGSNDASSTLQYDGVNAVTAFTDLAAGNYRIGFYENGQASGGLASFAMVSELAAIPLPAGGVLLLTALGAAGLVRRRKG